MVGQVLSHYTIREELRAGGMGVVYLAHDQQLDRDVAIKVLPSGALADQAARRRFRREALALAKLNHSNIETVHEFGNEGGLDFLVTEYIPGLSLDDKLAGGAPAEKEVLSLGSQLADGLEAAHKQGVIHRDLKPGNLHITPEGRLKIIDFGLASLLEHAEPSHATTSLSETMLPAGTLRYMAPEQLRGENEDCRTDIWAVGVVLYEMATGRRPFDKKTSTAVAAEILHEPPVPPGRLNSRIASRLEDVILKCLEKEPGHRYQSAKELGVDLCRLAAPRMEAAKRTRRRRVWFPLAIAAVLILLAVLFIFDVAGWRERLMAGAGGAHIESLAVLPLRNLSGNPEQEYLTDGITDELITDLAKLGSLRVISYTSAMQFKDTRKSLPEIASELNVDAIVEGTVQISSGRIHVNAQMVRVRPEAHLWADSYDHSLGDAVSLQEELATEIAGAIHASFTPKAVLANHTVSPEAYDLYLKGRYFWNRRTAQGLTQAIDFFERAITDDPTYAAAYSGLADSYNLLHFYGGVAPGELIPKARAAATKAIQLDEGLAEGHTSLAYVTQRYDWDWMAAEREYKRALELNPNYATAHHWYAEYLMVRGRFAEAQEQLRQAKQIDPLSLEINTDEGLPFYFTRQYDRAIKEYNEAVQMDPNFAPAHFALRDVYELKGAYADAIREFRAAIRASGGDEAAIEPLARAFEQSGAQGYWRTRLELALTGPKALRATPTQVANIYAALGDRKRALDWLERAYRARDDELVWLAVEPWHDSLRSDPEFMDLMRRVGLAQ